MPGKQERISRKTCRLNAWKEDHGGFRVHWIVVWEGSGNPGRSSLFHKPAGFGCAKMREGLLGICTHATVASRHI